MGLGLSILATNRPYEGFLLSLPVAIALFAWLAGKHSPPLRVTSRSVVLPLCVVMALLGMGITYYNWCVTGHPFEMPYQAERQQYAVAPYMLWQPLRAEPVYHNEVVKRLYAHDEVWAYWFFGTWFGRIMKLYWMWAFYLSPALTFPFLTLTLVLPFGFSLRQISKRTRFLLFTLTIGLFGLFSETFASPHYFSPQTSLILALVMTAMRCTGRWEWRGRRSGLFLVRTIPLICLSLFVLRAVHGPIAGDEYYHNAWYQRGAESFGRAALQKKLEQLPEKQLVVVRYERGHLSFAEWVYNAADIDASKVVWARELTPVDNQKLIKYFSDRRVWLLEADEKPHRLSEYPIEGLPLGAARTEGQR